MRIIYAAAVLLLLSASLPLSLAGDEEDKEKNNNHEEKGEKPDTAETQKVSESQRLETASAQLDLVDLLVSI